MKSSLNNRQHEKDCWGNVLSQLFVSWHHSSVATCQIFFPVHTQNISCLLAYFQMTSLSVCLYIYIYVCVCVCVCVYVCVCVCVCARACVCVSVARNNFWTDWWISMKFLMKVIPRSLWSLLHSSFFRLYSSFCKSNWGNQRNLSGSRSPFRKSYTNDQCYEEVLPIASIGNRL
jgi:hypothetical protein